MGQGDHSSPRDGDEGDGSGIGSGGGGSRERGPAGGRERAQQIVMLRAKVRGPLAGKGGGQMGRVGEGRGGALIFEPSLA